MEAEPVRQRRPWRALIAGFVTFSVAFSTSLVWYWSGGQPSHWNMLWLFTPPLFVAYFAFRTWPGRIISLAPLIFLSVLGTMASAAFIPAGYF
jgi:hypothetical protein